MNVACVHLLGGLLAAGVFGAPVLGQPAANALKKQEEIIAEVCSAVNTTRIETAEFHEKMPFAEFLDKLNRQLQKEAKITIRLDREAFGKEADKMLRAEVSLPPVPKRMSAGMAMRLAWGQTTKRDDVRFTARPGEFIMTTRERSLFTASYDMADIIKSTQSLHDGFVESKKRHAADVHSGPFIGFDERADPKRPGEWLVRQIEQFVVFLVKEDSIRLENGSKLVVHADPLAHRDIAELLVSMRRMLDVAVVMNARLHAVDRAYYDKHFAPAFVDPVDKSKHRLAVTAYLAQMKMLAGLKPIHTSDADKLMPRQLATFLATQNFYRYQARPGETGLVTAFEGFTLAVRPTVSPDLRCLRLELSEDVAQLVKITKGMMVDLKTGKDVPIELPNVRKSAASGTIEIHDGQAILLQVDYRPAAKDQVWLVLAEPRIYIEAEEEEIRKSVIRPMPLAEEHPQSVEPPVVEADLPARPAPIVLPDSDDVHQILEAVIENLLTDPQLKSSRDFYGTSRDKNYALDNDSAILWPKKFRPTSASYVLQAIDPGECKGFKNRLMGIRLDGISWDVKKPSPKEVQLSVAVHNVGGSYNGAVIGGCHIGYVARHDGKRWTAEWTSVDGH